MGVVLPTLGMAGKLAQTPHQQCRAVMAYLTVAVGGLLPFCILERREATARAHAGAAAASQLPPGQQEAERQRWLSALLADDALFSPVHAYLASCLLFMPATAAAA